MNFSPQAILRYFSRKEHGNGDFVRARISSVSTGGETVRYRGPVTQNLFLKRSVALASFQDSISRQKQLGCTCRLYKKYLEGLGYGI